MSSRLGQLGVLVGVDGSPASRYTVDWAAREATMRGQRLTLLHAVPPVAGTSLRSPRLITFARQRVEDGQSFLDDAVELARAAGVESACIDTETVFSSMMSSLVALSGDAQLVVVGARECSRLRRYLSGSAGTHLLRHARCPVAVIHDEDPLMPLPRHAPVLLGIGGAASSESATTAAVQEAAMRRVPLIALHIYSDPAVMDLPGSRWLAVQSREEEFLTKRLSRWQQRFPHVLIRCQVERGRPAERLLTRLEVAQVLVLGNHWKPDLEGLCARSVTATVLHRANMPVIVINFESCASTRKPLSGKVLEVADPQPTGE